MKAAERPLVRSVIHWLGCLCWVVFSPVSARAVTTLSSGHVEIFEVEYEQVGTNKPTLHFGVHAGASHFEPADVVLEVGAAALTTTSGFSSGLTALLGAEAYVLPVDLDMAVSLGLLEAGVGRVGFPDSGAVTFTMVAAGPGNPGNFALFTAGNAVRLSATGGNVGASSFNIVTTHVHYNWGFSTPGTYAFDLRARYTDAVHGVLESAVETYTFHVIPEPSVTSLFCLTLGPLLLSRIRKTR